MQIKPTQPGALASGIEGIQRGINKARENAHTIATSQGGSVNELTEPLIDLKLNLVQVQASAEVVKTVDELFASIARIRDNE